MIWIYVINIVLLLCGCRYIKEGYNSSYISKDQCNAIKGFFIVVVFARHIWPYLWKSGYEFTNLGDNLFRTIDGNIDQLLVVMFLFYSGYGVIESIQNKGDAYVRRMPIKRLLPTLLNLDVAVLVFLILDLSLGINYGCRESLLAFTGWTSIGNSNWYIFVILACYAITYICGKVFKTRLSLSGG